jgi:hypothetical protein
MLKARSPRQHIHRLKSISIVKPHDISVQMPVQSARPAGYHRPSNDHALSCPGMRLRAHSSRQTRIASPGIISSPLPLPSFAFPRSQSVSVTIFDILSKPLFSSACSIVCVAIRPFESNEKTKIPENSSPLSRLKIGLSPPSSRLKPLLIPPLLFDELLTAALECAAAFALVPLPFFFSVFHRTTSFSSPKSGLSCSCGRLTKPVRTIFSDRIFNFTFPTRGTQPHATGAVHNAALYGTFPLTAGRCGWVDGNRCSETEGERISCGMGVVRMFGSKGESVRNAVVWVSVQREPEW